MSEDHQDAAGRYHLADLADLPGVDCPCGTARRAFGDVAEFPGTIHLTEIKADAGSITIAGLPRPTTSSSAGPTPGCSSTTRSSLSTRAAASSSLPECGIGRSDDEGADRRRAEVPPEDEWLE